MNTTISKPSISYCRVDESHVGQRIDNFLLGRLKGVPKSHIYRIVRKGEVRVNKKRIKPDYRVKLGDDIRIPPIRLAETHSGIPKIAKHTEEALNNQILYEDENIIILNKPSGIAVHGGSGISYGVIEALRQIRPKAKFLELAHRLDRETSGCLLIAKKASILKELHALLREGNITKIYHALVNGHWPKQTKIINAPLQKYELRSGERMVSVRDQGKAATTEFRVLERYNNATLIEAKPLTGRTHQIRVHAAHAGHAIIGDEKYGDKEVNKTMRNFACKRLFLHANSLSFVLNGKTIQVEAPLPKELMQCLKALKKSLEFDEKL